MVYILVLSIKDSGSVAVFCAKRLMTFVHLFVLPFDAFSHIIPDTKHILKLSFTAYKKEIQQWHTHHLAFLAVKAYRNVLNWNLKGTFEGALVL